MSRFVIALVLVGACTFSGNSSVPSPSSDADGRKDASGGDGAVADAAKPPDAREIDAAAPIACESDPGRCTNATGQCMNGACVIDRDTMQRITCPANMPCIVVCDENDNCTNGVDCGSASSCDVTCTANNACQTRGVDCGMAASCKVVCTGNNACQHGPDGASGQSIECRAAAMCDVTCKSGNAGTCADGIDGSTAASCDACCASSGCDTGNSPGCDVTTTCP